MAGGLHSTVDATMGMLERINLLSLRQLRVEFGCLLKSKYLGLIVTITFLLSESTSAVARAVGASAEKHSSPSAPPRDRITERGSDQAASRMPYSTDGDHQPEPGPSEAVSQVALPSTVPQEAG
ncbi:hypothetical protein Efla_001608 [Eimeria flavescens]